MFSNKSAKKTATCFLKIFQRLLRRKCAKAVHADRGVQRKHVLPWYIFTGVRPPAGTALSLPLSVFCGWLFILSFYVLRAAYNITYDRYFSQSASPFLLKLFFRPPDNLPWRLVFVIIGECACICSRGACFHIFSFIPCHDGA